MPKKQKKQPIKKSINSVKKLREENARLKRALDASMVGILLFNTPGTIKYVNQEFLSIFGYQDSDQLLGKKVVTLFGKGTDKKEFQHAIQIAKLSSMYVGQFKAKHKSGDDVFVWARIIVQKEGSSLMFHLTARDITDQVAVETSLRESQKLFSTAFENAPIGLALVSPDGKFLQVNNTLATMLGYSSEELEKKTWRQITHKDDEKKDSELSEKAIAGKLDTYTIEKRYYRKDKKIIWVQLDVSIVRNSDGTPKFFVSQIQEITDRKKQEAELEERKEELEKLNRFMIGREYKMIELKKEIAELKQFKANEKK